MADTLLLDNVLPDFARTLRRIIALRATTIIAVTSYAMSGDREKAVAAGCDGYIEKPIDPRIFVAEISTYLPLSAAGTTP